MENAGAFGLESQQIEQLQPELRRLHALTTFFRLQLPEAFALHDARLTINLKSIDWLPLPHPPSPDYLLTPFSAWILPLFRVSKPSETLILLTNFPSSLPLATSATPSSSS